MVISGAILAAMALMGLLSAGSSIAGSVIQKKATDKANETNLELNRQNNLLQQQLTEATNVANLEQAREANETTRYLAENAHQIEMADLEAAGLNPILAAQGGASVPQQVISPLSTANTKAGSVQPSAFDTSALTNLFQSMASMMMMHTLLNTGVRADYYAQKTIGQEVFNEAMPGLYGTKIGLQSAQTKYMNAKAHYTQAHGEYLRHHTYKWPR